LNFGDLYVGAFYCGAGRMLPAGDRIYVLRFIGLAVAVLAEDCQAA
jgi:hypothetical protein